MAFSEEKAQHLLMDAEKKEKSSVGFFASLFGSQTKLEDAAELYVRAANMFKMGKKWAEAGNSFCKAALLQLKVGSNHQAATDYVDAGNCYRKADPNEAVTCLLKAVEIYTDMGRFSIAAKHHVNIAEIYETELVDIEKAITSYEQAADYYKGEESKSSANKCLVKVAHYAAQLEQYEKAIEIYEQIGTSCMDNQLLKYSAKDYFFKAAMCHMCVDVLNAQIAIKKFEDIFPQFTDSRECKLVKTDQKKKTAHEAAILDFNSCTLLSLFLKKYLTDLSPISNKLLEACEEQNTDTYTDAVKEYDSISRLDQWTTTILLRIKKTINSEDLR